MSLSAKHISPHQQQDVINKLNERITDLNQQLSEYKEALRSATLEVEETEQQLAEALKDAERYRWLRGSPLLRKECFSFDGLSLKQGRELDEAIDAAIRRSATAPESAGSPESPKE